MTSQRTKRKLWTLTLRGAGLALVVVILVVGAEWSQPTIVSGDHVSPPDPYPEQVTMTCGDVEATVGLYAIREEGWLYYWNDYVYEGNVDSLSLGRANQKPITCSDCSVCNEECEKYIDDVWLARVVDEFAPGWIHSGYYQGPSSSSMQGSYTFVTNDNFGRDLCGGTLTVTEPPPPSIRFNQDRYSIDEANQEAGIRVVRSDGWSGTFSVEYTTSDGTATAGSDYTSVSGTLNLDDGEDVIVISLLQDDIEERGETVELTLSNPAGAQLGDPSTATLVIADIPDLTIDSFSIDASSLTMTDGRYTVPVDVTVRNVGGGDSATGIQVRFSDPSGWSTRRSISRLAPGSSKDLHLDWDITDLLTTAGGRAEVSLTVTVDPDNTVDEVTNDNNTRTKAVSIDVRPRITDLKSTYQPGTFLAGPTVKNSFEVWVDWNGDLAGNGDPDEVVYMLNGQATTISVGDLAAASAASQTYDMGSDLQAGANVLQVQATNNGGFNSDPKTITLHQAGNAPWLAAAALTVESEPPNAQYDKVALYAFEFEWPNEIVEGFFDVPADEVRLLRSSYGPSLDSWRLAAEYRTDGVGTIEGGGSMEGEVRGMKALSAGGEVTVDAGGSMGVTDDQLALKELAGQVRAEGMANTPAVPLSPYLPFVKVQGAVGAGVDATLGVEEAADGSLEWKPFVLGLDATAEGTASTGAEGVAYAEGTIGGQPRGEFQFPPEASFLKSLDIDLYAEAKAQALKPGGRTITSITRSVARPWPAPTRLH